MNIEAVIFEAADDGEDGVSLKEIYAHKKYFNLKKAYCDFKILKAHLIFCPINFIFKLYFSVYFEPQEKINRKS